ncbi:MAG: tetratricopeptide repeat protein [Bacteroidales bacterium]|nr:tetratricopeptide repeat protein [Bacteroidales bacterium]
MKKNRLTWLCLFVALAVTACNHSGNNTPKNNNGQEVEEVGPAVDPLDLLNDSIAMDENRADLYLKRAHVYMEREQVGMAMMDVNHSIQLDSKNVDAFLLLSDIYFLLGDDANITATLNKALEVDPYDARPMVKLAELNLLQQNYNLCFGYVDNALKISTFNPNAYFVKGMAYMAKQDTVSALKNFMIAREQDATFLDPQREICGIYQAQHNPLTESFMRSMLANFPDQPMVRYDLALFLQDNGYPEEALAHYDTLLMLQPDNSRLLFNKGYVYFVYLRENEKALEYFNKSLQSDPSYLDALFNKGHVLEQMGDYVQAKSIYEEVLQQQPDYRLAIAGMNRISNLAE